VCVVTVAEDTTGRVHRHSYALVDGHEHALEMSSTFVAAGLRRSERVVLVRSTRQRADSLLTRLREDGAEPSRALRVGQLVLLDGPTHAALQGMSDAWISEQMVQLAAAAVRDGYTGIRFGALPAGMLLSPHEDVMNDVVRAQPVSALCLYRAQAPAEVLTAADRVHDRQVLSTALYDDGDLRVTLDPGHGLRLAGRISPSNRAPVMSMLSDAAAAGRRTIDVASLRDIDPHSLSLILTTDLGVHLRHPHPAVRKLARQLSTPLRRLPPACRDGRTGVPVPGHAAATVAAHLVWRTFGDTAPDRPESVLDWAGLLGRPAGPVTAIATAHHTTTATLLNRIHKVRARGVQTPLSPLVRHDATRATQSTEDDLSRRRIAELLGLSPPRQSTTS
jgi:hypothetical protein